MAERAQLLVALVGEEGDQADRLQELEHAARGVSHGPHHACGHAPWSSTGRGFDRHRRSTATAGAGACRPVGPAFILWRRRTRQGAPLCVRHVATSTVILEDLEDMAKHARIFEALRSAALSPEKSLTFLQKAIRDIPESEKEKE
ncbi:Scr1 family TA system antitoxin-like transcriptional regulator [Streptomyces sp. NPDC048484]|uniref:Scr1 family TA system antitoxin-like transcriptional regulator n=1 Tax=Streptomyces sp. NPDC048484 TaxID=3155146 RepID=UPI00342C35BB